MKAFSSVEIIKRRESLIDLKISCYSDLQKEDRNKLHQSFYKSAFPNQKEKVLTTRDLIKSGSIIK